MGNDVWGINKSNQIFRRSGTGWEQLPGELTEIAAGANGAVWGVNGNDEIYHWLGGGFQPVANGALKQIAVRKTKSARID
jgi:hypothetical protein